MSLPSHSLIRSLRDPGAGLLPAAAILSLNGLYHLLRLESAADALTVAVPESLALWLLFVLSSRTSLAKASLLLLALPYVFFIPGWLDSLPAVLIGAIFCASLVLVWRSLDDRAATTESLTLPAFLLIVLYVNLSGVGGYGYQSPDHSMHNSRLSDLIHNAWPVHYGEQHLVYYLGYFLPAASIGKLTSYSTASYLLYFWAIFAVTLALRWLQCLSSHRLTAGIVVFFMLFGALDLLNVLMAAPANAGWRDIFLPLDIGRFEFITREVLGIFIGNQLSHTLQLYFAPHQVIAGWIGAGLLSHLYLSRQAGAFLFTYALLCLWSPFVMLGLAPLVLLLSCQFLREDVRSLLSIPNTVGAATLLSLFVIFYLGGSAENNPSFSLFSQLNTTTQYAALGLWLLAGWGVYLLLLSPALPAFEARLRIVFIGLALSLLVQPLWIFGSYNDLLCRGSAPLFFLLTAFLLRAWTHYRHSGRRSLLLALGLCVAISSLSALQQHIKAVYFYGRQEPPSSVIRFKYGWENLGPADSVFGRYLRKPLAD